MDLIEHHVETYLFCQSMFPLEGEFEPTSESAEWMASSREKPIEVIEFSVKVNDSMSLTISLGNTTDIRLSRFQGLSRAESDEIEEKVQVRLGELRETREGDEVAIMELVEYSRQLWESLEEKHKKEVKEEKKSHVATTPLTRVWFWFPSLSTREKRDDMVSYSGRFGLTGFVMAGKPGVLCVEGEADRISHYMAEIKAVSWADIPAFQKKVSERHRETIDDRVFSDMQDITRLVDQTGRRGNRAEMSQVRDFLGLKGLGEAFGLVIGGGQF